MADDDLPIFTPPPSLKARDAAAASDDLPTFTMPAQREAPKQPTVGEAAEDIGRGALAGVTSAAETIPGIPGSLVRAGEYVGDRARTGWMNLPKTGWLGMGTDPAGRIDTTGKTPEQIDGAVRAERDATRKARGEDSRQVDIGGLKIPTPEGVLAANPDSVSNYEPKTGLGRAAKTSAGVAAGMVGGVGPTTFMTRAGKVMSTVGAVGGTLAGEAAKDSVPESWLGWKGVGIHPDEMRAAIPALGGLAGASAFGATVAGIPTPDKVAERGLANARLQDLSEKRVNPSRGPMFTPDEIAEARALGVEVPDHLGMGRNERGVIANAAGDDPNLRGQVEGLNQQIEAGRSEPFQRVHNFIDNSFGANGVDMQEAIPAIRKKIQDTNDANYEHVMNLPHAQDVWSPELQKLYSDPTMHPYIDKAIEIASRKQDGSIRPPVWQDEVQPTPSRVIIGNGNQWQNIGGTPGRAAGYYPDPNAPPTLRFHDTVKRLMDPDVNDLYAAGRSAEADALKSQRERLLGETDRMVSEYPEHARDPAHEVFGERDALQAGYQFHRKLDDFGVAKVRQAFNRMTDDQFGLFQYGLAGAVKNDLATNPATAMRKIEQNRAKYDLVFGKDWTDRLLWEHRTAAAAARAQGIDLPPHAPPVGWLHRAGSVAGKAVAGPGAFLAGMGIDSALEMLPGAMKMLPPGIATTAGTVAAPALAIRQLRKGVRNSRQGVANKMIVDQATGEMPPLTIRRAAGGEIGPRPQAKVNVESAANALIQQVKATRDALSGETQNILAQPDTHVVQALSVAKKALG